MVDFQEHLAEFNKKSVEIIAASSDSKEHAIQFANDLKVTYKVAYGLNPRETSEITGAYYCEDRGGHLHATGFVIGSLGQVVEALYCDGTKDRLKAKECLSLIQQS